MVVRKIFPSRTIGTIIFPNGAPLTFAEIRPPFLPRSAGLTGGFEPLLFRIHNRALVVAPGSRGWKLFPPGSGMGLNPNSEVSAAEPS